MLLYHGTAEPAARRILREGIKPRGNRTGNWTIQSGGERVYLTDCYAPAFAQHAASGETRWALVEINLEVLDESLLLPDEDFLEQTRRRYDGIPGNMEERTAHYRREAANFRSLWEESLIGLGTIAYAGVVPPKALTRVAFFAPTDRDLMLLPHLDPAVVPVAHMVSGRIHRAITDWFFGETVTCSQFTGYTDAQIDSYSPNYRRELTEWLARRERVEILDIRRFGTWE